jgi:hypothetical protein
LENIKMSLSKSAFSLRSRAAVLAGVAALALSVVQPTAASAAVRHYHHGGGGAAALGAFAGIVGAIGGIAAAQERHDYYYDNGPGYYAEPGYGYYAPYTPNPLGYGYYDRGGF